MSFDHLNCLTGRLRVTLGTAQECQLATRRDRGLWRTFHDAAYFRSLCRAPSAGRELDDWRATAQEIDDSSADRPWSIATAQLASRA
jgi:hypothetical protein